MEKEINPEFNLLDEKWIRVLCQDYSVKEVSLTEALTQAHTYRDLAGELKAQDIAVLRLLLAVLHTVFSRVNEEGTEDPIEDDNDALDRWRSLWQEGSFPGKPIREYLERYRDRFYLFHPQYPFYQVPEADIGTKYTAAKLNGEVSESNHKVRLFSGRAGEEKNILTYPEAARWLLYINGFDDTSAKKKGKGPLPSISVGWLGKLGLITAVGDNLFESLMFNLILLQDGKEKWNDNHPIWEEHPHNKERSKIPLPDNPAELLTLQSRRILLKREKEQVTGYSILGGDFFEDENAFTEQMTIWRKVTKKKTEYYIPKHHDGERQLWRDFNQLISQKDGDKIPGVLAWITRLQDEEDILPSNTMIALRATSVQYDKSQRSSITDEFGDSLSFTASLLTEKGKVWQILVVEEIERCEKRALYVGNLAKDLVRAAGGDEKEGNSQSTKAKEKFFYRLDIPFRNWLLSLKPEQGGQEREEKRKEWNATAGRIARVLGREMVEQAGPAAFAGREVAEPGKGNKKEGQKRYVSASSALNYFLYQMTKIEKEG